jgi:hypothetical protein
MGKSEFSLLIHYPKEKGIKDVTITENKRHNDFFKETKILLVEDELNQLLAVKVLRNGIKKLMLQIMER